jgi:hypothetical protein
VKEPCPWDGLRNCAPHPLAAFMDFAAAHGVPPLHYGAEQLEEDRRTLAKLRS